MRTTSPIPASMPTGEVASRFNRERLLDALPVLLPDGAVKLVVRSRFLAIMTGPFGYALFANRPIQQFGETDFMAVAPDEDAIAVISRAAGRDDAHIWDDIVVTTPEGYLGTVSMRQLMTRSRDLLLESIANVSLLEERHRQLNELHRLQTEFVANMTHELRAPLNTMLGIAQLIASDPDVESMAKDEFTMLISRGRELQSIVDNMLELHKLEAGTVETYTELVEANTLLNDCIAQTKYLVGNRKITIESKLCHLPDSFVTDPVLLRRIVMNLLSNAAKFTNEGTIRLEASQWGSYGLRVSVLDTGPGIRKEDLPRLFSKFTQLESTKTKRHAGTGLGLVIVKSLTELLGGTVSVTSEVGKGSAFSIELPALPLNSVSPPSPSLRQG